MGDRKPNLKQNSSSGDGSILFNSHFKYIIIIISIKPVTMDGLRVYKKQEDFVEAPLSKKKKSSKKNARKKEIREISNRLKSEERIQCDCQGIFPLCYLNKNKRITKK